MQFGISESVSHWARYRPYANAVSVDGKNICYRELDLLISNVTNQVIQLAQDHTRVAVALHSRLDYLIAAIATVRAGKSLVLVNTGLSPQTMQITLRDANVVALIHDENHRYVKDLLPGPNVSTMLDLSGSPSLLNARDLPYCCQPKDEWGVFYSSGTTGVPKGIERDHESVVTELLGWCLELGLNRNTTFYIGRPIFYTGGIVLALATILVGGRLILNDYSDYTNPDEVWTDYQQILACERVTWSFFVPDQLRHYCRQYKDKDTLPPHAESILVMGAPITGEEKLEVRRSLGSQVVESWGNSESLGTITDPEDLDTRPGSVGRPFLTDELSVVGDDLRPVMPLELGRIAGSQEAGFTEYASRPDATRVVKQGSLIVSEDIGYVDHDGYFYIRGRKQDCVEVEGTTVFLPEIETIIRRFNCVRDCAVVARQRDRQLTELVAVIVVRDPAMNLDELLCLMNAELPETHRLTTILPIMQLPRVPSGKIDKVAVQGLVEEVAVV